MTRLILDAGALLAFDRQGRAVAAKLEAARRHGLSMRTNAIVLAQVGRHGGRQANLARLLKGTEIVSIDEGLGTQAGSLLGRSGTADPINATVVIAEPGDRILTSDPDDMSALAEAAHRRIAVIRC